MCIKVDIYKNQKYKERKDELNLALHKLYPVAFPLVNQNNSQQQPKSSTQFKSQDPDPLPSTVSLDKPEVVQPKPTLEILPRPNLRVSDFVTSTTLVIMPPADQWKQIVDIKKNHMNPRIKRPPYPHITLLQPFVDSYYFDIVAADLTQFLQQVEPFHLNFNKFEIFDNRGSATLFLNPVIEPPDALHKLQKLLADRYPEVNSSKPSSFEPHIGVGYFKSFQEAKGYQVRKINTRFLIIEIRLNIKKHGSLYLLKYKRFTSIVEQG